MRLWVLFSGNGGKMGIFHTSQQRRMGREGLGRGWGVG